MKLDSSILKKMRDILNLKSEDIEEIYLSVGGRGLKPGIGREFPSEPKGGESLGLVIKSGPRMFPKEENL